MIKICRLTKRQVEPNSKKLDAQLEQVKIFSMKVGHGVGSIDFVEEIDELTEEEYAQMIDECEEYAKFKLGNLTKYFEVEIYPEHIQELLPQMPSCKLKKHLEEIKEGYVVIRKVQ